MLCSEQLYFCCEEYRLCKQEKNFRGQIIAMEVWQGNVNTTSSRCSTTRGNLKTTIFLLINEHLRYSKGKKLNKYYLKLFFPSISNISCFYGKILLIPILFIILIFRLSKLNVYHSNDVIFLVAEII